MALGENVTERIPIAERATAAVTAPGMADKFTTPKATPNASRGGTPAQQEGRGKTPQRWSTGFFSMHKNCCGCIYTTFCPCLVVGRMGSFLFAPNCFWHILILTILHMFVRDLTESSYRYREKLRKKFMLPEEPCSDFCTHAGCMFCALCQEHRELTIRGVDLRWFYPKGHCGSPTCRAQHPPSEMLMQR